MTSRGRAEIENACLNCSSLDILTLTYATRGHDKLIFDILGHLVNSMLIFESRLTEEILREMCKGGGVCLVQHMRYYMYYMYFSFLYSVC